MEDGRPRPSRLHDDGIFIVARLAPQPRIVEWMVRQACANGVRHNVIELYVYSLFFPKSTIEVFLVPDCSRAAEALIDAMGGWSFHGLQDFRESVSPIVVAQWREYHVDVIGHHNQPVHLHASAVPVQTRIHDETPHAFRQNPSSVSRKCHEKRLVVGLVMRKFASVFISSEHSATFSSKQCCDM
jgi:hypothetical protein